MSPRCVIGSSRNSEDVPTLGEFASIASNSRSAMRAAKARASSGFSVAPISSFSPSSAANWRPASSIRVIRPWASVTTRRAPTSTAVRSMTLPPAQTAIFEVPPPMSTFITMALSRADRDQLAGLRREEVRDSARVFPPHGDTGENESAGVDLVRLHLGEAILLGDEGAELFRVDGLFFGVGRQQDVGFVEGLARRHHIAAVEPLQHNPREHQMRCR